MYVLLVFLMSYNLFQSVSYKMQQYNEIYHVLFWVKQW